MYQGRLWTMRQYAGFGTAQETNQRFRHLLGAGQTGLSVAFDLPTQMGIDSDDARALGEVGRVGVAIDTVDDMHVLLDGIPLDKVSTSMTINATAATLLAMYIVVADERGIARDSLSGTIQNDILKEYIARGTYIYPPEPSLALIADTFRFCAAEVPNWNPISISGYHIREAGATAVQELAFTFANAMEYVRRAVDAALPIDSFAPRLSFFFAAHNDLFEEAAKFRAARRMYARLMRERFGANEASCRLRFHTQTGGVTLQAQQPLNNVVRVAYQALAGVLGGTQSLHTNGFDEALALPTEQAATLALRTQQILAYESGAALTADPLAGSYYVEHLTNELERQAMELLARVDEIGGAAKAIAAAFFQEEIARSAYEHQMSVERGDTVIVGVNRFADESATPDVPTPDFSRLEREQVERLRGVRQKRDAKAVDRALQQLGGAAAKVSDGGRAFRPPAEHRPASLGDSGPRTARDDARPRTGGGDAGPRTAREDALMVPLIVEAVRARASVGEISNALGAAWGGYRPGV